MRYCFLLLFVLATYISAADRRPVAPEGVKPVGPYSPGILAGDYLYVSGQGARDAKAQLPASFDAQVRQCLDNVKAVVEAGGLKLQNVVQTQVYLADISKYSEMQRVYASYFPNNAPATSTIRVARMPTDTPVEISAIAVTDLKLRKNTKLAPLEIGGASIISGVELNDRFYLSGVFGYDSKTKQVPKDPHAQVKLMINRTQAILKSAELEMRDLVAANVYIDAALPVKDLLGILEEALPSETATTVIRTAGLPFGAHVEITGVASRSAKREGKCKSFGETIYCSGRGGEVSNVLNGLKGDLGAAKVGIDKVVATNVYLDQIDNFNAMNKIYATYFAGAPPTRTTVQPTADGGATLALAPATDTKVSRNDGPSVQISLIAVR
jgi:2-iminobutanoate/2-iminopropanoate deaminase